MIGQEDDYIRIRVIVTIPGRDEIELVQRCPCRRCWGQPVLRVDAILNHQTNPSTTAGRLTYSVSGGADPDRITARAGVEAWESALLTLGGKVLTLDEVAAGTQADIKITLKKGGGVIAELAKRSEDRQGFIKSVSIAISLKAFGVLNDQDTIGEVVRHEVGHALGLDHADADCDDLLNPTVGGNSVISQADVNGVIAAQHWKLADGVSVPHRPHTATVTCPAS